MLFRISEYAVKTTNDMEKPTEADLYLCLLLVVPQ